jgi:hypothetical protein
MQTTTIEGTKIIDAWVRANEPPLLVEFGPPLTHVFIGFVKPMLDASFFTGRATVTGRVLSLHNSRPPALTFFPGQPFPGALVALNDATGRGVYAGPTDEETSSFTITNVPPGTHQLFIWDTNLDMIFSILSVVVPPGNNVTVNLGDIMVNDWFSHTHHYVFNDEDQDGFRDDGEIGIPDQAINLRFRDGSIYQSMPTDVDGFVPFDEVFPFFYWLVAEVDFMRYKATGVTVAVDAGGEIPAENGWTVPSFGILNPQPQYDEAGNEADNPNTGNNLSRTETGPVLLEGFQVFAGQTNVFAWGKAPYGPGENGGISGIVHYAVTRAEDDPTLAAAEVWEPGIPRVQVNLYQADELDDTQIADVNGITGIQYADVDRYPFGWGPVAAEKGPEDVDVNDNGVFDFGVDTDNAPIGWSGDPAEKGLEDNERSGSDGVFDLGDAIQFVHTDSWDDSFPTGAQNPADPTNQAAYDGLGNFNQVRPAVFDGGYAFMDIPAGTYIVEADTPPPYKHQREEDKNVVFGESYKPASVPVLSTMPMAGELPDNPPPMLGELVNQAVPVGDLHDVPAELSLFPGEPTAFAGESRHNPDRKRVRLQEGQNAAANFFLFTDVPIAGQIVGIINNDLANQNDPNAPNYVEKYSPPYLPISIRDWDGNVIAWTVSDRFGGYTALVPSTYTADQPQPSGMSPSMLTVVLNDGSNPDLTFPPANPRYGQTAYTFNFMPGVTTYLDTPVIPITAFPGSERFPADYELPTGTPTVAEVNGPDGGPYVSATGQQITIESLGAVEVANPYYDGANSPTETRDYGFGAQAGSVTIGGVALDNVSWGANSITGTVAANTPTGQLVVTRGDNGLSSVLGVTVTVGNDQGDGFGPLGKGPTGLARQVLRVGPTQTHIKIQDAIDAANPGDLILVESGEYAELPIMHKPVQLQGYGAGSTILRATQFPTNMIFDWRTKLQDLWTEGAFDMLPAQELSFTFGLANGLGLVEGAGISVWGKNALPANGGFGPNPRARFDGFTVEGAGALTSGGIFVNGYGRYVEISNNRIQHNGSNIGGGITVGHHNLSLSTPAGLVYQDAQNDHIRIHNNLIAGNGGVDGAGGGVALYTGADFYEVTDNYIAGNLTQGHGGGIGHLGRSNGGFIARNRIVFNQSFNQALNSAGGGIFIGGAPALVAGQASSGTGSVRIEGNLVQGNQSGTGDGGGIRVESSRPGDDITIVSNFIVNNVAGFAGGGISLQDAADVVIRNNTIAHNDSTATAGAAFINPNQSAPQPAGVVVRQNSAAFDAIPGVTPYSFPTFQSNIVWRNRAFYFQVNPDGTFGLQPQFDPSAPQLFTSYSDTGVLPGGGPGSNWNIGSTNRLTGGTPAPQFVSSYFNGPRDLTLLGEEFFNPQTAPAFDEGGNFIDVQFGPLTLGTSDYHLTDNLNGSMLVSLLTYLDADGDTYTLLSSWIGADRVINSSNLAPVAVGDAYTLNLVPGPGGRTLNVTAANGLLANDYDPDGGSTPNLSAIYWPIIQTFPGTVTGFNGNTGSFSYMAPMSFEGTVSFTYLLSDGSRSSVGTVTITVTTRRNRPPAPSADPIQTMINTPGSTRVLPNDPDVEDTHTYAIVTAPTNGTATVSTAGSVTYTPNLNYAGADSLTVSVSDGVTTVNLPISITVSLNLGPSLDLQVQLPPDTDGIDTDGDGDPNNDHVYVLLGAGDGFTTMADARRYPQYIFSFHNLSHLLPAVLPGDPAVRTIKLDKVMSQGMLAAEFPAPTLKIREGQRLYLNLANVGMALRPDLFDPHTVHWHGFPQAAPVFDGVPDASLSINMMANYTFFYDVVFPGTYMYHCHVEATEHMQMGMLGNLFVTPKQDNQLSLYPKGTDPVTGLPLLYKGFAYNDGDGSTGYDLDYPIQLAGFDSKFHDSSYTVQPLPFALMKDNYPMINGRGYPDTVQQGSLVPPAINTYVASAQVTGGAALDSFNIGSDMGMLSMDDGAYNDLDLVFAKDTTTLALRGVAVRIRNYVGATMQVVLAENLPAVPVVGDTFSIGKASQKVSTRIEATRGQKILLRISSLDVTRYYTLASALPMQVVGWNARLLRGPDPDGDGLAKGVNLYYTTNSVTLGGGESVDAIIDTSTVEPGTYLLYTSNLNYLSNNQEDFGGMMTEIVIN